MDDAMAVKDCQEWFTFLGAHLGIIAFEAHSLAWTTPQIGVTGDLLPIT
jgi:hypothetical protein